MRAVPSGRGPERVTKDRDADDTVCRTGISRIALSCIGSSSEAGFVAWLPTTVTVPTTIGSGNCARQAPEQLKRLDDRHQSCARPSSSSRSRAPPPETASPAVRERVEGGAARLLQYLGHPQQQQAR